MLHKFYVVVDDPSYKEEIRQELISEEGHETIPARSVDVINPMPQSEYNSAVLLTQEEADALISDLRIRHVERDPLEIGIVKKHTGVRTGVWDKGTTAVNTHKNWGLLRSINTRDTFTTGQGSTTSNYTYNLDGTGVDVVIMDGGVEPNHPEFAVNADGTGGTRVVDLDWRIYGVSAIPTGGFMGDNDGHGTNVASIAVGNTCGWAPKAAIYSLRTVGTGNDITDGRTLDPIDDLEAWQALRAWHNAKTVDPTTGYKRPTIVNCSFGFFINYYGVTSITYRGTTNTVSTTTGAYGTIGVPEGGIGAHGYRYATLEAEIASTINAGVVVVAAAGNDRHKIDIPGGLDYNNYWASSYYGTSFNYHRGPTPAGATDVITVGCLAAFTQATGTPEHKRSFSNCGPRVDIWAAGDYIMGGYANAAYAGPAVQDPRNSAYYLNKISGTSQASPQVTGALALVLQARPWMTHSQCRTYVTATAQTWLVNESYYGGSGYTNFGSLQGGPALALYQPFNGDTPLQISNTSTGMSYLSTTMLSANRTSAQLGGRLSGGNAAVSTYSTWTFSGSNVTMTASGIPYHSFHNSAAFNVPYVQNFNYTWTYRGGTNVAGSQATLGGGRIGFWLNGVSLYNPSAQFGSPNGYPAYTNWHYNAAWEAGEDYGYTFGEDLGGGHASPTGIGNGTYHYHDGSMITTGAWVNGTGYVSGAYGTTGLAECDVIPYLLGGLEHPDGHSKIVGICADGYPIYGPYGYSSATNKYSGVRRMVPGYTLNPTFVANGARTTNGTTPAVNAQYPLGIFVEDWSFVGGGDLDTHNGRYCVTPEYPNGTYAYFIAFDVENRPTYPYVIGNTYYGTPATL